MTENVFESSSSRVPEVQRCRSQHNQTWAEYAHARTSSQHALLSGYSSRFFFFFLDKSKSVSFAGMFPTVEEERAAGEML